MGLGEQVAAVWDETDESRLQTALGPDTAARTRPWLDAWATEWRRARVETCTLHTVQQAWSADLRERADECLEERLLGFTELLAALSAGDAALEAVEAATALPRASACGEAEELARRPALPASDLVGLRALRSSLARAAALDLTGKYGDGLKLAREGLAAAAELGWPPAVAEARVLVGELMADSGDYAAGAREVEEAYFAASRAAAETVAVGAATRLVALVGIQLSRPEDGLRWARMAELGLLRLGSAGRTRQDALLLAQRGNVRRIAGDIQGALADMTSARALDTALLGADHPHVVQATADIAVIQAQLGEHKSELESLAASHAALEQAYGPEHPKVATVLNKFERSLAIRERALGPDHPDVVDSLGQIATARFMHGESEEAVASLRQVLAIHERIYGPEHATVALSLCNLAYMQAELGKYDEARANVERGLEIRRRVLGPDHLMVATALGILALIHRRTGDLDASWDLYQQALPIREKKLPAGHREIAGNHRNLVHVAALRGDIATARAHLELAKSLKPAELAEARFAVAGAWWTASPRERADARALAELARGGYAGKAKEQAAVDAWLASHPSATTGEAPRKSWATP